MKAVFDISSQGVCPFSDENRVCGVNRHKNYLMAHKAQDEYKKLKASEDKMAKIEAFMSEVEGELEEVYIEEGWVRDVLRRFREVIGDCG